MHALTWICRWIHACARKTKIFQKGTSLSQTFKMS